MQNACAVLYYYLWPVRLCRILKLYFKNETIFGKKMRMNATWMFFFFPLCNLVWNISRSTKVFITVMLFSEALSGGWRRRRHADLEVAKNTSDGWQARGIFCPDLWSWTFHLHSITWNVGNRDIFVYENEQAAGTEQKEFDQKHYYAIKKNDVTWDCLVTCTCTCNIKQRWHSTSTVPSYRYCIRVGGKLSKKISLKRCQKHLKLQFWH